MSKRDGREVYTKTVCTSVGSTNVKNENAVLSDYITTLKNKQKLDVSSEGLEER
jgi:hypothetical protein